MDWLPLVTIGAAAFVATNADDALLLLLFFGDRRFRAWQVFVGQAAGIGVLVLVSLLGALLAPALPERAIGLLGLLPIAIGIRHLVEQRSTGQTGATAGETAAIPLPRGAAGWQRAAMVAGVTLANGGDNLGVYVPLFATRPPGQVALLLVVFAAMLLVWLFGGYYLARRSPAAGAIRRLSGLMPWVLIVIGVIILIDALRT